MAFSIRSIAPWIGAAVATALPGPLGAAALAVGKALGGKAIEPTVDAITNAVQGALGDPAQIAALRAQDNEFKLAWQAAGFKQETDILALNNDDRKDARAREIAVRDRTPEIGFYLLLTLFGLSFMALAHWTIPESNKVMMISMVSTIGVLTVAAATYFYGTTQGSARKTELLAQAPSIDSVQ
jgi:hypothetical protein